ncbi:MAG: hypothetical protein AAGA81_12180 [Acidobacteriota bacterium]
MTASSTPITPQTHRRPPVLLEARSAAEIASMWLPLLSATLQPRQERDASPILVAPGFGADDSSTLALRQYLKGHGFRAEGWGLGRNLAGIDLPHELDDVPEHWAMSEKPDYRGEAAVVLLCERLIERVETRSHELEEPMTLLGWSLGGYLAREAARELPDLVDRVITLGSPVVGGPKYTAAASVFRQRGQDLDWIEQEIEKREAKPIRQPITAIYSRSDAIVSWPAAIDRFSEDVEHIEVSGSHLGMGFNPTVWRLVKDTLEGGAS